MSRGHYKLFEYYGDPEALDEHNQRKFLIWCLLVLSVLSISALGGGCLKLDVREVLGSKEVPDLSNDHEDSGGNPISMRSTSH